MTNRGKTMAASSFEEASRSIVLRQNWFWLAVIGSALILLQTLPFGFGYDHGFARYMAWASLHGRWPYIDVWNTTFPGVILIHASVIAMGGTSALSFRVFDWLVQILTAILIFNLAKRLAGPRAGAVSALLYAATYTAGGYYHTAQKDSFIVPLLLLGVWSLWNYSLKPKLRWMVVAGIGFGLMCIIRPTYALLVAILVGYLLLVPGSNQQSFRLRVRDISLLAILCGLPMALFVGVYACRGALPVLVNVISFTSAVYPKLARASTYQVLHFAVGSAPQIMWAGVGISVLSPAMKRHRWHYGLLIALLGACTLIRVWESKTYLYLYWPTWACAAIMAGIGLNFGITALVRSAQLSRRWQRIAAALITGVVILWSIYYAGGLLTGFWSLVPNLRQGITDGPSYRSLIADSADQAEVARYLREHTDRTDLIQIWGAEPGILYAAGRFAASRFVHTVPFLCEGYERFVMCDKDVLPLQETWKKEFLDSMVTKRPRYIVTHYENESLAVVEFASWAPDFPELREILDRDYEIEATFGVWSVFGRKEGH